MINLNEAARSYGSFVKAKYRLDCLVSNMTAEEWNVLVGVNDRGRFVPVVILTDNQERFALGLALDGYHVVKV